MQEVRIETIVESPTNPRRRFDEKRLAELADNIRQQGVLQPILLRPVNGHHECVFGHRRLRAAKAAGLVSIPAQVRDMSDAEVLEAQLVENCQREDIDPMDEADAYAAIVDAGVLTAADVAMKVSKSPSHVYARLRLAKIGEKGRAALQEGKLLPTVALLLTRFEGAQQDKALAQLLRDYDHDGPISLREANWILRSFNQDLRQAPFDTRDAELLPKAGACTDCPKRSGNQVDLFGDIAGDEPEACTDPRCYETKVSLNWEVRKAEAEDKGVQIFEPKVVYGKDGGYHYLDRKYVEATGYPSNAYKLGERTKTWKALLGKALKPAITQDPRTGAVVEIYDAKAARRALPDDVKKVLDGPTHGGPSTSKPKKKSEGVDPFQVSELTMARVAAQIAEKAPSLDELQVLRLLASDQMRAGDCAAAAHELGWFAERKGAQGAATPGTVVYKEYLKRVKTATVEQLRAVLLVAVFNESGVPHPDLKIGEAAIRKAVTAELTAQAKAAAKEKKPPAKPAKGKVKGRGRK